MMQRIMRSIAAFFVLLPLTGGMTRGQSLSPPLIQDPYRNFVGHWTGTVAVNPENMPATVSLNIIEEKGGKRMRWDYEFGSKGEKGHGRATKWVVLSPDKNRMDTEWKGKDWTPYATTNLAEFTKDGMGTFTAITRTGDRLYARLTFELHATTMSYLWEQTTDQRIFTVYSDFRFTRQDAQSSTVQVVK